MNRGLPHTGGNQTSNKIKIRIAAALIFSSSSGCSLTRMETDWSAVLHVNEIAFVLTATSASKKPAKQQ
jgi:hypothetical protein